MLRGIRHFLRRKTEKLHGFCDLLRGKCQMPHGILSFRAEKAKSCEEFWIFCAERAKFRSGFPILSLAGAKSPFAAFQPAARFPKFEGGTVICRSAQIFRHRNQIPRPAFAAGDL